ncbi:FAD/NAD(P)-binding domain-containing protein [Jackrogersella minutella]|nr:FAD/NAD(P)-binding domain-containing protein [Jackrogersella minutella]
MSFDNRPMFATGPPPTKNIIIDGVLRFPLIGTKVLVVGSGAGGLMTALECWRKGMEVEVIEKSDKISALGDIFGLGPSALTTFHCYPSMLKEYDEIGRDALISFHDRSGKQLFPPLEYEWNQKGVAQHSAYPLRIKTLLGRYDCAMMLFRQCKRLNIPVTFGVTVNGYEEDTTKGNATAVASDGRRFTADVVIAADGIGTKSHAVTLGKPVKAMKTGYVTYRIMYSTERLKGVAVAEEAIRNVERPILMILQGEKVHCVTSLSKEYVTVAVTAENDDMTVTESWSSTVPNEDALSSLQEPETWSPFVREVIRHTPEGKVVKWSLVFRDPQPRWTSSGGRIVQVGDSAHSFLPTSGNGAVQALEDAASLAECLRLAGKGDVRIATKVHELLRYQRVSLIQHTGYVNMQDVHREADSTVTEDNHPMHQGKWLWAHNPEKYATENFVKGRAHLENGEPFENTNLPVGHKWSDWTVEDELAKHRAGISTTQALKNNGDWSLT